MGKVKYICIKEPNGIESLIIFEGFISHDEIDRQLGNKAVSAGFVSVGTFGCYCYGESFSLKLKSRKKDTHILKRMFIAPTKKCNL